MPKLPLALLALTLMSMGLVAPAHAANAPDYIKKYIPDAQPVGQGRLTYMFWDVYDATLYGARGKFNKSQPFALTLKYLREIDGRAIADRSAEEMRQQGGIDEIKLAQWHEQMLRIFPKVKPGTTLTGIYLPKKGTMFYRDSTLIGTINDKDFSRHFFDIWLGHETTAPELRRKLTGI